MVAIGDNNTLNYAITDGNANSNFAINSNGLLTTAKTIDYESNANYSLIIEVTSGDGNTTINAITINVINIDEVSPVIANQSLSILENMPIGTVVGAVDATDNDRITNYAITAGNTNDTFAISRSGLLITANIIDYEVTPTYNLTIEVADGAGNTANGTVTVNVTDINFPPNVTTPGANEVLITEATLRGELTDLGDSSDGTTPVSEHGFIYSTIISSESHLVLGAIGVEKTNLGAKNTTGQFSNRMTGLEECRTYYYRAYAVNDIGTNFSEVWSFTPGRQHQTFNLSGITNGEQSGLICPYGTHTYNVPLSNTHVYNLTVDSDNNVLDNFVIYEDTTTNELYIQAGPFTATTSGITSIDDINSITIIFSGAGSGRRYLVLPLVTTNHRLTLSNGGIIGEDYTLNLGKETSSPRVPTGTGIEQIDRLPVDETPVGFSNYSPFFYWVHIPPNRSILDTALTAISNGNICSIGGGTILRIYLPDDTLNSYDSLGDSSTNRYRLIRILNNNSNVDYRKCQFKFRTR